MPMQEEVEANASVVKSGRNLTIVLHLNLNRRKLEIWFILLMLPSITCQFPAYDHLAFW